jgi:serine/threonine protein phosphatase 1
MAMTPSRHPLESCPRMSLTYVIPDIHGRDDLLGDALAAISTHSPGDAGLVVTIGDYVDKGPDSRQVIDRLRSGIGEGRRLVALKGNHDAMMAQALRDPPKMVSWLEKGGTAALASYGGDPAAVPQAHIDWLDQLSLMHIDAHRLYVHAGVDPAVPLDRQDQVTLLCKRYSKGYPDGYGELHVVHGHDNFPEGPLLYSGRTNLDTLAWRTGRLVIGIFDDDRPGGPVDLIVIKGAPAAR